MKEQSFSNEKQVKDLENALDDLQNIKLGSSDDNETQKLKRLFLTFKTKYQQALKELSVREQSCGSSHLSKKMEELQEENKALTDQQQILKEMVKRLQNTPALSQEDQKLHEQNQKLRQALQEKDQKIADLHHYELGFKRLSDDNRKLEHALNSQGDGERQQLLQELDLLRVQVESLTRDSQGKQQLFEQKHLLEGELEKQKVENQRLKGELAHMKETMVRGLREARELKQYYQSLIDEKTSVLQKNSQIQKHIDELRADLRRREHDLESAQTETAAAKAEKQEAERALEREKSEKKERDESLNSLAEQIQLIRGQLRKTQEKLEENEEKVIEAQQHLGKKVRESSLLSESVEEKHAQIIRLQEEVLESKVKVSEAHASLESEQGKAKKIQEQMEGLELKYFRTYEKLQEAEAEVRELKRVEEKHQQMQQLLSSLGSVMGQPVGLTQPVGMVPDSAKPPVPPVDAPTPKKKPKSKPKPKQKPIQDSLFDMPDAPPKYKNDFFE